MRLLLLSLALLAALPDLSASLGETVDRSIARYGKPERDALKQTGLLFFRKGDLCLIAHFERGTCDVLSIFSSEDDMGLPKDLGEERIKSLLRSEGRRGLATVARFHHQRRLGLGGRKDLRHLRHDEVQARDHDSGGLSPRKGSKKQASRGGPITGALPLRSPDFLEEAT